MVISWYSTKRIYYALPEKLNDPNNNLEKMFQIGTHKTADVTYVFTVKVIWWAISTATAFIMSIIPLINLLKG